MAIHDILLALIAIAPVFGSPVQIIAAEQSARGVTARDDSCPADLYATTDVDYFGCKHAHTMNSDGQCLDGMPGGPTGDTGCSSYCEVKVTFFYGQEIPYDNPHCRANADCTLTISESVTHTETWTVEVGVSIGTRNEGPLASYHNTGLVAREDGAADLLKATFNAGASHSWSDSYQHTVTSSVTKPKNETRCGHFSWVPLRVRSCGTLTSAEVKETSEPEVCSGWVCPVNNIKTCDKTKLTTTGNWCVDTQVMNADKSPAGTDIFVVTDCDTNTPTPDAQDAIYYHHGVSLDPNWAGNPSKARVEN